MIVSKAIDSSSLSASGKLSPAKLVVEESIVEKVADETTLSKESKEVAKAAIPLHNPNDSLATLKKRHWDLHVLFRKAKGAEVGDGFTVEHVVNAHARIVDDLYNLGVAHPPPPDEGLDDLSYDFEAFASKQPRWFEIDPGNEVAKVEKALFVSGPAVAGVHSHTLDRASKRTKMDGAHAHLFVLPDGTAVWSSESGAHEHILGSSTDDYTTLSGAHKHLVALGDGTVVETEMGGGHVHQLQVDATVCDGIHTHRVVFADGRSIHDLMPGEAWIDRGSPDQSTNPPSPSSWSVEKASSTGVMIALFVPASVGSKLVVDQGESLEDLHITLAYLGKLDELPVDVIERANLVVERLASSFGPLDGKVSGLGRFHLEGDDADFDAFYASPDIVKLAEFRVALVEALKKEGIPVRTEHGFDPHITLAYVPKGAPAPLESIEPFELSFANVVVAAGKDRYPFPFAKAKFGDDPYLETPPEIGRYGYTIHDHWIGNEKEMELRFAIRPSRTLLGWTMASQMGTTIIDPVETMARATAMMTKSADYEGALLAAPLGASPAAWLDVEGVTKEPLAPGVFKIVEQGDLEFGAQKADFHEYFLGKVEKGSKNRLVFEKNGEVWKAERDGGIPFVLTKAAVESGWMPSLGSSALPESTRKAIPAEWQYWSAPTIEKAKEIRDALVKATDNFLETMEKVAIKKSEELGVRFSLASLSWKEDGVEKSEHRVYIDEGGEALLALSLKANPLVEKSVNVSLGTEERRGALGFHGLARPSSYMNHVKTSPVEVRKMDEGEAKLSREGETLRLEFIGKALQGSWTVTSGPNALFEPAPLDVEVLKSAGGLEIRIAKAEGEKRLVTGIVLEPDEIDAHGDWERSDVIMRAAHRFLADFNRETEMGLQHRIFGSIGVQLVESWIAPVDMELGGQKVKKGSWMMTVKVVSDHLWRKVKSGEITGFSIGGVASVR
jgi:2'-5' RNA ligase